MFLFQFLLQLSFCGDTLVASTALVLLLAASGNLIPSPSAGHLQGCPSTPLASDISGNGDLYGVGVRVGLYLQLLATAVANLGCKRFAGGASLNSVNLWFLTALSVFGWICSGPLANAVLSQTEQSLKLVLRDGKDSRNEMLADGYLTMFLGTGVTSIILLGTTQKYRETSQVPLTELDVVIFGGEGQVSERWNTLTKRLHYHFNYRYSIARNLQDELGWEMIMQSHADGQHRPLRRLPRLFPRRLLALTGVTKGLTLYAALFSRCILGILVIGFTVYCVEFTLKVNNITKVNDLSTAGQLIALLVSIGGCLSLLPEMYGNECTTSCARLGVRHHLRNVESYTNHEQVLEQRQDDEGLQLSGLAHTALVSASGNDASDSVTARWLPLL
ncbi:hypothetical protein BDZ91DRAFT_797309 [Kalaharituber pfeilii]|nr:hypothetical protein BDZ91DRAFT_797309 [Kalaharituber pfeilii]